MISNIPTFGQQQDFQARNRDLLNAAQREPLTKDEIERTKAMDKVRDRFVRALEVGADTLADRIAESFMSGGDWSGLAGLLDQVPKDAKVGTQLRIRLPNDWLASDGQTRGVEFTPVTPKFITDDNRHLWDYNPFTDSWSYRG